MSSSTVLSWEPSELLLEKKGMRNSGGGESEGDSADVGAGAGLPETAGAGAGLPETTGAGAGLRETAGAGAGLLETVCPALRSEPPLCTAWVVRFCFSVPAMSLTNSAALGD